MKVKWVVHVAWMGMRKVACRDLVEKPKGTGRTIFRWILKKSMEGFGLYRFGSGQGQLVSSCELGDHKYICLFVSSVICKTSQTWQLCRTLKLFWACYLMMLPVAEII
jgi:hypothetical protein